MLLMAGCSAVWAARSEKAGLACAPASAGSDMTASVNRTDFEVGKLNSPYVGIVSHAQGTLQIISRRNFGKFRLLSGYKGLRGETAEADVRGSAPLIACGSKEF